HILRVDTAVASGAFSWVEHCDWIPALLCGGNDALSIKRSRCAAGHKAMWHEVFGGLSSQDFLTALDPKRVGMRDRLFYQTYTSNVVVGTLSTEWAARTGLPRHVKIGVGALDAHMGAVGAVIRPYTLVKVIGTSTCDMLIAPNDRHGNHLVNGICGQVDGS